MGLDYLAYVETFNAGNDDELVERWFTEDFVYVGAHRVIKGRSAWRDFFRFVHNGVREVFRAESIFTNDTGCFCEIDTDFHGLDSRPDFPLGPLAPGEMYTVKFFANYKITNGKFSHLKTASWPVNANVTVRPRLGGEPTQIAAMQSFVAALEHGKVEQARQFFAKSVNRVDRNSEHVDGSNDALNRLRKLIDDKKLSRDKDRIVGTGDYVKIRLEGGDFLKFDLEDGLIARLSTEVN